MVQVAKTKPLAIQFIVLIIRLKDLKTIIKQQMAQLVDHV